MEILVSNKSLHPDHDMKSNASEKAQCCQMGQFQAS